VHITKIPQGSVVKCVDTLSKGEGWKVAGTNLRGYHAYPPLSELFRAGPRGCPEFDPPITNDKMRLCCGKIKETVERLGVADLACATGDES
jgi:hypothetical protein